jgi:FemAB-related protein (PEP-CTERM system-associated)
MSASPGQPVVRVLGNEEDGERIWQSVANGLPQSTLAHAAEWRTVIRQAYGHEPLYLIAEDEEGRAGVLPSFLVRRPVVGPVAASMPFLDAGGPCAASETLAKALVQRLLVEASRVNAATVDIRCTERLSLESHPQSHKVNMSLALPADPDRLWKQFDGSVRNQVRKAQRSGLSIEFGGAEKLEEFHAIFAARMHDLGSPVHSKRFFAAVFDGFGSRARVAVVRKGTTPVGGLVALARNDVMTVPWASCLPEYFSLCSNMLLYWETIRAACLAGFARFDFGRSTRDSGTYRFKRQWGALESPLYWYSISAAPGNDRPAGESATAACLVGLWKRLPLAVTRRLGPHVRRYLIQ